MRFRRATVHDISGLVALDTVAATDTNRIRQIESWIAEENCRLLDEDGTRAYGVLNRHFHGQPFIEMLMVDGNHRRMGYGAAMLRDLCSVFPNEAVWTSTNSSNQAMQSLLFNFGFELRGKIDLDPGDPEIYYRLGQN